MNTQNLKAWLERIQSSDEAAKLFLAGLIASLFAYNTKLIKLTDYWFWIANDTAIILVMLWAQIICKKGLGHFVAVVWFWFAVSSLVEDIMGVGSEYSVSEYVVAIVTVFYFIRKLRK